MLGPAERVVRGVVFVGGRRGGVVSQPVQHRRVGLHLGRRHRRHEASFQPYNNTKCNYIILATFVNTSYTYAVGMYLGTVRYGLLGESGIMHAYDPFDNTRLAT